MFGGMFLDSWRRLCYFVALAASAIIGYVLYTELVTKPSIQHVVIKNS